MAGWRIALVVLLASCASGEPGGQPAEIERFVRVQGSCERARALDAQGTAEGRARPVGDTERYRVPLFVRGPRVRVRANAVWPSEDDRNVIGTLPGRRWVLGHGPLENAEYGAGIGYAVAAVDDAGRLCRGYLSLAVVEMGAN